MKRAVLVLVGLAVIGGGAYYVIGLLQSDEDRIRSLLADDGSFSTYAQAAAATRRKLPPSMPLTSAWLNPLASNASTRLGSCFGPACAMP